MQKVIFIGNLGADPDVKYTQAGKQVVTLSVAVNERVPDRESEGQWTDKTSWYRVRVMGRQVEYVSRLAKGGKVHVIGNLSPGAYISKQDNQAKPSLDVFSDEVTSLSPRPERSDEGGDEAEAPRDQRTPAAAGAPARRASRDEAAGSQDLEDLPF